MIWAAGMGESRNGSKFISELGNVMKVTHIIEKYVYFIYSKFKANWKTFNGFTCVENMAQMYSFQCTETFMDTHF